MFFALTAGSMPRLRLSATMASDDKARHRAAFSALGFGKPATGGRQLATVSYGQVSVAVAVTAVDMAPGPAALLEACAVTITVPTAS